MSGSETVGIRVALQAWVLYALKCPNDYSSPISALPGWVPESCQTRLVARSSRYSVAMERGCRGRNRHKLAQATAQSCEIVPRSTAKHGPAPEPLNPDFTFERRYRGQCHTTCHINFAQKTREAGILPCRGCVYERHHEGGLTANSVPVLLRDVFAKTRL